MFRCWITRWWNSRCWINDVVPNCRCDNSHLVSFEQRGTRIIHNTIRLGEALSDFDVVVEDFVNGDRFEVKPIILSHDGHLRTMLLKDQRARWDGHHPSVHRSG